MKALRHTLVTAATAVLLASCGGGGGDAGSSDPLPQVTLTVSNGAGVSGNIVITLESQKTPVTVSNFLAYVNSGFYNGTVFHRHGRNANLSTFVMQGGGYAGPIDPNAAYPAHKATNAPIALEVGRGLSNLHYTVAMARTSVADSATSEFFINTTDNAFLDTSGGGYAVFGTVTSGTAVVDAMVAAACSASTVNFGVGSPDCLPNPNITITAATKTR